MDKQILIDELTQTAIDAIANNENYIISIWNNQIVFIATMTDTLEEFEQDNLPTDAEECFKVLDARKILISGTGMKVILQRSTIERAASCDNADKPAPPLFKDDIDIDCNLEEKFASVLNANENTNITGGRYFPVLDNGMVDIFDRKTGKIKTRINKADGIEKTNQMNLDFSINYFKECFEKAEWETRGNEDVLIIHLDREIYAVASLFPDSKTKFSYVFFSGNDSGEISADNVEKARKKLAELAFEKTCNTLKGEYHG